MNTINAVLCDKAASPKGRATRISFDEIKTNDNILLWTQKSVYSFQITEKAQLRGKLSSASRGELSSDAVLVGAVGAHDLSFTGRAELATNTRALFVILSGEKSQRLLTSEITRMVLIREEKGFNQSRR